LDFVAEFSHPGWTGDVTSGNVEMCSFHDESDDDGIEAFLHLLAYHGSSMHFGSKRYLLLS
jgi:hypothetical protein